MSGGSWNYVSNTFEDVAKELMSSEAPERVALGQIILPIADALHAIEWADSGDCAAGSEKEAILKALGPLATTAPLQINIDRLANAARNVLAEIESKETDMGDIYWLNANTPKFFEGCEFEITREGDSCLLALIIYGSFDASEFRRRRQNLCDAMLADNREKLHKIISIFQRRKC
jgi:hypothetical protein